MIDGTATADRADNVDASQRRFSQILDRRHLRHLRAIYPSLIDIK
jgi:hypothetical protein